MTRTILIFGSLSVILLILFQLQHWSLFALGGSENLYFVVSGILFLLVGIAMSRYFFFEKEKRKKEKNKSLLSKQEVRVLELMAEGLSNKEIGKQLFIAESTVKSHVSKILMKLNARRRTEAIKIGQELELI